MIPCRKLTAVGSMAMLIASGCSQSIVDQTSSADANAAPDLVVAEFLEAVRTGDDQKAAKLLSPLARERTAAMEMVVAPPGSDTAKFRVCSVETGERTARVRTEWTDLDTDGLVHTDEIVWILRLVPEGWRVSGMASKVFKDQEPIALNFEEPQDMLRRQQLAEEELARRDRENRPRAAADSPAGPDPRR